MKNREVFAKVALALEGCIVRYMLAELEKCGFTPVAVSWRCGKDVVATSVLAVMDALFESDVEDGIATVTFKSVGCDEAGIVHLSVGYGVDLVAGCAWQDRRFRAVLDAVSNNVRQWDLVPRIETVPPQSRPITESELESCNG